MDLSSIKIDLFKKTLHNRLSGINSDDDFKSLIIGLLQKPEISNSWGNTNYLQANQMKNGHFLNLEYKFKTQNSFRMARDIFLEFAKIHEDDIRIQIEYDKKNSKINIAFHDNTVIRPVEQEKRRNKEKEVLNNIENYIKSTKYSAFLAMTRIGLFTTHKNNLLQKSLDKNDINDAINEHKINSRKNIAEGYQKGISMFVAYGHAFYNERVNHYLKNKEPELFSIIKSESSDILNMAFKQHPEQKKFYLGYKKSRSKNIEKSITDKLSATKTKIKSLN